MVAFLRENQLNIMLGLSYVCGIITLFVFITTSLSMRRKFALALLEMSTMALLIAERAAYIYHGDPSPLGYIMVRVTNFCVFFMTLTVVAAFNQYLKSLYIEQGFGGGIGRIPKRIHLVDVLYVVGVVILAASQYFGYLYYFDENNNYIRGRFFFLSYIVPIISLLIQVIVIIKYRKQLRRKMFWSVLLFAIIPMLASIIQFFVYGISLTDISIVGVAVILYVFALWDMNDVTDQIKKSEIEYLAEGQKKTQKLFEEISTSFVNAIDARDIYTSGHSKRVADYSRRIAEMKGMDEEACNEVYFAALLHDVGKIGTPEEIIRKGDELNAEEEEIVRRQPMIADQILSNISDFPYLVTGARYHCERYDGKGYPEGLKGEEIPETARIIAIANAYDIMSSKTINRDPLPQQLIREEFVRESGAAYDPEYTGIMLQMIDMDTGYSMQEDEESIDTIVQNEFDCAEYRSLVSNGISLSAESTVISFKCRPNKSGEGVFSAPSIILFDSLDARVHDNARAIEATRYTEYGELWFDGHIVSTAARNMKIEPMEGCERTVGDDEYIIEAVSVEDHVRIRLYSSHGNYEAVVALLDNSRSSYIALTGENCHIDDIDTQKTDEKVDPDEIERIAEQISYIGRLESDLPNIQIVGKAKKATPGVLIKNEVILEFHTMTLPAADMIWNCPYLVVFHSDDGIVNGEDYREYAIIRFDGELVERQEGAVNHFSSEKRADFVGWDAWKEKNKAGLECRVRIARNKKRVFITTENLGLAVSNTTIVKDIEEKVYVALTGQQIALTDIRVAYR